MDYTNKIHQIIVSQEKLIMVFLVLMGGSMNMLAISVAAPHFASGNSDAIYNAITGIYFPWGLFVTCMGGALILKMESKLVIHYPTKPYIGKYVVLCVMLASVGCGIVAAAYARNVFGNIGEIAFIPLAFVMAAGIACSWMTGVRLGLASPSELEAQAKKDEIMSNFASKPNDKIESTF